MEKIHAEVIVNVWIERQDATALAALVELRDELVALVMRVDTSAWNAAMERATEIATGLVPSSIDRRVLFESLRDACRKYDV